MIKQVKIFGTIALCLFWISGRATHVQGGLITVKKLDNLRFEFTFIGYRDRGSTIPFGGGDFSFGDGTVLENVAQHDIQLVITQVSHHTDSVYFRLVHEYEEEGTYIVSYEEEYRNADILNISNSVATPFYVETEFNTEYDNSTPVPQGSLFSHIFLGDIMLRDFRFTDAEGDSVLYDLVVPKQNPTQLVGNYRSPDHPEFYSNYETGNYAGDGTPVFFIDRKTGSLVWDMAGDAELNGVREYSVAVRVREYRSVDGVQVRMSSTTVDLLLRLEQNPGQQLSVIRQENNFCVAGDEELSFEVISDGPYKLIAKPAAIVSGINGLSLDEIVDSTFAESASFDVSFVSLEEEQTVTFRISPADEEDENFASFTYLLSSECEAYILSTDASIEEKPFILYPNPAQEEIHIRDVGEQLSYKVIGLDGKIAGQGTVRNGKISLQNVENGIYIFQLLDTRTNQISTQKLVVRK